MRETKNFPRTDFTLKIGSNKTRQGYARKRILKPAGYFFVHLTSVPLGWNVQRG
jgi:hypothetical protein